MTQCTRPACKHLHTHFVFCPLSILRQRLEQRLVSRRVPDCCKKEPSTAARSSGQTCTVRVRGKNAVIVVSAHVVCFAFLEEGRVASISYIQYTQIFNGSEEVSGHVKISVAVWSGTRDTAHAQCPCVSQPCLCQQFGCPLVRPCPPLLTRFLRDGGFPVSLSVFHLFHGVLLLQASWWVVGFHGTRVCHSSPVRQDTQTIDFYKVSDADLAEKRTHDLFDGVIHTVGAVRFRKEKLFFQACPGTFQDARRA